MADFLDEIISDIESYVVAPLNAFGLGGFLFDVQGESVASLQADITDHYTEDNRAIQDHIAIKPKRITLKGYVGELVVRGPGGANGTVAKLTQKLTEVAAYLPSVSAAAQQIQQTLDTPTASGITLTDASDIFGAVKNLFPATGVESNQQNAYSYFKALQSQKVLMGIQTPWEFMTNMAIETIVAVQTEDSQYISDFSVTFKQMRIAQTLSGAFTNSVANPSIQGDAAVQAKGPVNIGSVPGASLPSSLLVGVQSSIKGVSSFLSNPIGSIFKAL